MIANRTTTIAAEKTLGEIQSMLAANKALKIMTEYDNGKPSSLSFQIVVNDQPMPYRLPCNWQGTLAALKNERQVPARMLCEDHARRVAWRVVRDWLRMQLSLIEAGASSLPEVMLPWMIIANGETVSQVLLQGNGLLRLTQKGSEQ